MDDLGELQSYELPLCVAPCSIQGIPVNYAIAMGYSFKVICC